MGSGSERMAEEATVRTADLRRLHGAAGLVLVAFLASHFAVHACGLMGLATVGWLGRQFAAVWGSPVGLGLLAVAFLVHYLAALNLIYRRRRLTGLRTTDVLQLVLGLSIPPLLAGHALGAAVAGGGYGRVLYVLGVADPGAALMQLALSTVVWGHAAIGLWNRYRFRSWYLRGRAWAIGIVVGLPLLGIAGALTAGREVVVRAERPEWVAETIAPRLPDAETAETIRRAGLLVVAFHAFSVAMVFAARRARAAAERRRGQMRVGYPDHRFALIAPGTTVLEASRSIGLPHASVCGGRGRCSTCRVRVIRGAQSLSPAQPGEVKVLGHAGIEPGTRLGCQARVYGDVDVVPLVSPAAGQSDLLARDERRDGREEHLAVLFADLRGFTAFAEHRLPYDTVFVLNRFAALMQDAIEGSGGRIDKFLGDGVMAIFGFGDGRRACRQALAAAVAMQAAVGRLNEQLGETLGTEFRLGIGIHYGSAVVGSIGVGPAASVTVIGDVVNTASRLEQATKALSVAVVASTAVLAEAGLPEGLGERRREAVPGRSAPLEVVAFRDLGVLERALAGEEPALVR
ncbi:adenylate/guanylate cyclase domain-containing protein [Prosthecomicrobium sp. N25]|uniref:adenylate/guanylate cyclase domain-containing protein n=1 Tax=Prosthecomicrobium sp. N25 TaxID=3129254 RepID=UPI003077802B